jgi:hypothetical protein
MTGRLFREWLVCFERKMMCRNRNVLLLMDQYAVHNSEGLTLKRAPLVPTGKCHQLNATTGPGHHLLYEMRVLKATSVFLVARNRQGCSCRSKKLEHLGCHARCLHCMEIHQACSNSKLLCEMWLRHCKATLIALALSKNF